MQHRSSVSPTARRESTGARLAARLRRRSGGLLTLTAVLAVMALGAIALPATATGTPVADAAVAWGQSSGDPGADCTLVVPDAPLSSAGLATPYLLRSTSGHGCHEASSSQAAFVEAVIYDPAKHSLAVYRPLVVDQGAQPAAAPVAVAVPRGGVVGLWFGFNGHTLTLTGPGAGNCVDGVPGSAFGHFAYCNAPRFFAAVNADPKVVVPSAGTGRDGLPCPTSRDFSVVDQHQADSVATGYRVVRGRVAQDTGDTRMGTALSNRSEGTLLSKVIDPALGCRPFQAPDLTDGGRPTSALALDELSAAVNQARPAALVPGNSTLVQVDGKTDVRKADLYRAGVDQPPFPTGQSRGEYCSRLLTVAPARLQQDAALLGAAASPVSGAANLLTYLGARLQKTAQQLFCTGGPIAPAAGGAAAGNGSAAVAAAAPGNSVAQAVVASEAAPSQEEDGDAALPATIPPPVSGISWGSSVMQYGAETYADALARVTRQLQPEIIRFYNSGAPSWPRSTGTLPLVISFKIPPAQILSGAHDAQLAAFFAATPRLTYWSYWHEPEDEIDGHVFTAAQYRAAWAHIAAIARASGKPLRATLILMGWSTEAASGRDWTDYYPGSNVIDVLAWDCYAVGKDDTPREIYGTALAASQQAGKPWAIAETGAGTVQFADPARRQSLLTAMSRYLATASPKPRFVTYFDSDPPTQQFFGWNISKHPAAAAAWRLGEAG